MNILVCVKRVPQTGGRIVLTADGQSIDTRFLGATISPHEECGVEEAVRLVEQHGGEVTVLTLGLFLFVINAITFWAAAAVLDGFVVRNFVAALVGSLLYTVIGVVIESALERLFTKK